MSSFLSVAERNNRARQPICLVTECLFFCLFSVSVSLDTLMLILDFGEWEYN